MKQTAQFLTSPWSFLSNLFKISCDLGRECTNTRTQKVLCYIVKWSCSNRYREFFISFHTTPASCLCTLRCLRKRQWKSASSAHFRALIPAERCCPRCCPGPRYGSVDFPLVTDFCLFNWSDFLDNLFIIINLFTVFTLIYSCIQQKKIFREYQTMNSVPWVELNFVWIVSLHP